MDEKREQQVPSYEWLWNCIAIFVMAAVGLHIFAALSHTWHSAERIGASYYLTILPENFAGRRRHCESASAFRVWGRPKSNKQKNICNNDYCELSTQQDYTYVFKSTRRNHSVGAVHYGLYFVNYDDGAVIESWDQRLLLLQNKIEQAISGDANTAQNKVLSLWSSMCPTTCQEALRNREVKYKTIRLLNLLLLAALATSGILSALAIAWLLLQGRDFMVLMSCWLVSALLCIIFGACWFWQTNLAWSSIVVNQQMPLPKVNVSFFAFAAGAGLYALAALGVFIADYLDKRARRKLKEASLTQHLIEQQYGGFPGMYNTYPPSWQQDQKYPLSMGMRSGQGGSAMPYFPSPYGSSASSSLGTNFLGQPQTPNAFGAMPYIPGQMPGQHLHPMMQNKGATAGSMPPPGMNMGIPQFPTEAGKRGSPPHAYGMPYGIGR